MTVVVGAIQRTNTAHGLRYLPRQGAKAYRHRRFIARGQHTVIHRFDTSNERQNTSQTTTLPLEEDLFVIDGIALNPGERCRDIAHRASHLLYPLLKVLLFEGRYGLRSGHAESQGP